jgi:hypothetical protein
VKARTRSRILYIECKSYRNDRGGARIVRATFSQTGRTIYYRGLVLQSCRGAGIGANYFDVRTGLEYWVSGPKRKGQDRHWAGGGKVWIDPDVADEYLQTIRQCPQPKQLLLA